MMITSDIRDQIVDTLKIKYGAWSGFGEIAFVKDETAYKRKIISGAQPLLAQERLRDLLDAGKYAEFVELLEKAGHKSVNLLHRKSRTLGDLRILNRVATSEQLSFCRAFFDLLYGMGAAPERLGRYVDYVEAAELPNYWAFPTYYLFVADPANNVLVKPRTIQPFLESIKATGLWSETPTAKAYAAIISLAEELRASLSDFGPQDMVDIQSVMYVCGNAYKAGGPVGRDAPSLVLGDPFSQIFNHYADAWVAFDLLRLAFEYLGVEDENDQRIALTVPKSKGKRALRLSFGWWVVLTFYGPDSSEGYSFEVTMKEGAAGLKSSGFVFKQQPTEPQVSLYELPFDNLEHFRQTAGKDFEGGLRYVGERFADWSRSPYRHAHLQAAVSAVFHPEQRQALLTGGVAQLPDLNGSTVFTDRAFELLQGIKDSPQLSYYQAHQADFKLHVEEPFQGIMAAVAASLPPEITAVMETKKKIFGKFAKNDFGKGGAWPHYWGAFYPLGSNKTQDAQLSAWMNHDRFEYGFYIGNYASDQRRRFVNNCVANRPVLQELMESLVDSGTVFFGDRSSYLVSDSGTVLYNDGAAPTWTDFLSDPNGFRCDVSFVLPRSALLEEGYAELVEQVRDGFMRLFPLMLAATSDDLLPRIYDYVENHFPGEIDSGAPLDNEEELNLAYPLEQLAADSGFPVETLAMWVDAVKRKRQAILYGPPGTGKTYLAERLARHLIGGGDGFVDVVQFHPAYAYEDFMQGIRPRPLPGGGLEYPVVNGRFLDFCDRAGRCRNPCILIIDEINRANLARVFGELMYLMEYRHKDIALAAGGMRFKIPDNVFILGTMNTADRSIALVDHALRRRFAFLEIRPNYDVLRQYLAEHSPEFPREALVDELRLLNQRIADRHYEVGISYFMTETIAAKLRDIWCMEIQPYLDEYFFDQPSIAAEYEWERIRSKLSL